MGFALVEPQLAADARERLREQLDRVGAAAEEVAGIEVEIGSPGPRLCSAALQLNADVVVVAAAAVAPLPLHRVGSTVRHLLRDGSRPVLIVKGAPPRLPPRRILAPLDLSLLAADSLRCGLALLVGATSQEPPEVVALHVVPDGSVPQEAPLALRGFLDEHSADYNGPIRREVRQGEAVAEILAAVGQEHPDLVLLGTHGRSGWQRLRLGSVAEAVIRETPASMLVIPAPAARGAAFAEAIGEGARCSA
jgi:nucleotide-binding universal stress UspA family protein